MRRFLAFAILCLLGAVGAWAQATSTPVTPGYTVLSFDGQYIYYNDNFGVYHRIAVTPIQYSSTPTGVCIGTQTAINVSNNNLFYCLAGTWTPVAGSNSIPYNYTAVPCASAMTFALSAVSKTSINNAYSVNLNCNVLSSSVTFSGPSITAGTQIEFSIIQGSGGGYAFAWPSNFLNPPSIQTGSLQETDAAFWYDGTNWHRQDYPSSGGGGSSYYQTFQNNGVSLPQRATVNCVPPMSCSDDSGNSRTAITCPIFISAGASHAAGCVPDPGATLHNPLYYLDESGNFSNIPSVANAALKPAVADGIQYVTLEGNDANDGLSWGTAKATVYAALEALPSGSTSPPTMGRGAVYIAEDNVPYGGPAAPNGGLWLMGSADPNYASPPSGWLKSPPYYHVSLICAAPQNGVIHETGGTCQEYWGGHTDNVHPAVWVNGSSSALDMDGFIFSYEAIGGKLGIDSNNSRSNGSLSSVGLSHMSFGGGACYQGIKAGPGLDIGGQSFWINIDHSAFGGCTTADYWIVGITRSSNVVTVTLDHSPSGDITYGNGEYIIVRQQPNQTYNGSWIITGVSGSTLTFAQNGPNDSTYSTCTAGFCGEAFPYNAAAIGISSGNGANGPGQIAMNGIALTSGGIWVQGGGGTGAGLYAHKINYEGDTSHPDMSTVEIVGPAGTGDGAINIDEVQIADTQVDSIVCGVEALTGGNISASHTTTCGPLSTSYGEVNGTVSPVRQGLGGIYNINNFSGNVVPTGRMFAPYAVHYPNLTYAPPWNVSPMTATPGQLAPDGTTGAVQVTNSSGAQATLYFGGPGGGVTPTVGSSYIYGVHVRGVSRTPLSNPFFILNEQGEGSGNYCQGSYFSGQTSAASGTNADTGGAFIGDGEWHWYWGVCKIAAAASGGYELLEMYVPNGQTVTAYGAYLALVPANTLSDNEIWAIANAAQYYPRGAAAGDVAMAPNQKLLTYDVKLPAVVAPTGAAGFTHLYMDSTANWLYFQPNGTTPYAVPGFTGTITNGNNVCASGTLGAVTTVGCTGGGGSTVINALQYSLPYYSASGTSNQISGVPGPTAPNGVPQSWVTIPSGGFATAPQPVLSGVPGRTQSGALDTVAVTDRTNRIFYTDASPSVAVILPYGTTAGFGNNFIFKTKAVGTGNVTTFTPTNSATINGASTLAQLQGQDCTIGSQDSVNYWADCHDPPLVAGANIILTRGDYGLTIASTAGGGSVTHNGNLTTGQLIKGGTNGTTDITVGNLSGDCTTSGTLALTCTQINGTAFAGTTNDVVVFGAGNTPVDSSVLIGNIPTQAANGTSGYIATYTGSNKALVAAQALPNGVTATTQSQYDASTKVATTAYVNAHGLIWSCSASAGANQSVPTEGTQVLVCPSAIPANFMQAGDIIKAHTNYEVYTDGTHTTQSDVEMALLYSGSSNLFLAYSGCDGYTVPTLNTSGSPGDEMREYSVVIHATNSYAWVSCSGSASTGTGYHAGSGNYNSGDNNPAIDVTKAYTPEVVVNTTFATGSGLYPLAMWLEIVRP